MMKTGIVKVRVNRRVLRCFRGHIARVYYSRSSPCVGKPIRLNRLVNGRWKTSWHELKDLETVNASAEKMNEGVRKYGEEYAVPESYDEANALRLWREFNDGHGKQSTALTFSKLVASAIERETTRFDTPKISEVAEQYLREKREVKMTTDAHIMHVRRIFSLLIRSVGDKPVGEVSIDDAEKILSNEEWSLGTRKLYCVHLRSLFNWTFRRLNSARKPSEQIPNPLSELRVDVSKRLLLEPTIIGHTKLKTVLEYVRQKRFWFLSSVVMTCFCGIRSAESLRIKYKDVELADNFKEGSVGEFGEVGWIHLRREITKTFRSRSVPIPYCAAVWLSLIPKELREPDSYLVYPKMVMKNRERKITSISTRVSRKLKLPRNSLRHTCSTMLGKLYGYSRSSEWCGHDVTCDARFYRTVSNIQDAKDWFSVLPS